MPSEEGSILTIAITPDMKQQARRILTDVFNIRMETLFPDIDGFCDANSCKIDENEMWRW